MSLLIAALKRSDEQKAAAIPSVNAQSDSSSAPIQKIPDYVFSSMCNKKRWTNIASITLVVSGITLCGGYYTYRSTAGVPLEKPNFPALVPVPSSTSSKAIDMMPQKTSPAPPALSSRNQPIAQGSPKSTAIAHSKRTKNQAAPQTSPERLVDIQSAQEADSVDQLLATAYTAYQTGDYATASRDYLAALARAPQNRDALLGLAVISQQQGKDTISVNYYRQVLALDPRDPLAHAGLASFGGSDNTSRENRLKQLIAQQAEEAALYLALGHLYAEQSRWPEAQQAYFNALTMEPGNALFAFNLAVSLDHIGQHKSAAKYYRQAIDRAPSGNLGFDRIQAERRLHQLNTSAN